jgi:nucleoid-associated protein YgaU
MWRSRRSPAWRARRSSFENLSACQSIRNSPITNRPPGRSARASSLRAAGLSPTSPSAVTEKAASKLESGKGSEQASQQTARTLASPFSLSTPTVWSSISCWMSTMVRLPCGATRAATGTVNSPVPGPTSSSSSPASGSSSSCRSARDKPGNSLSSIQRREYGNGVVYRR